MPSDALSAGSIKITSKTMPEAQIGKILSTPGIVFKDGHFEYPVSSKESIGNHLQAVFLIEPIAANPEFVGWIADDIIRWMDEEQIAVDVIFAPAQPAVKVIVNEIAKRRGANAVFWEYLPGGWFGSKVVEGEIKPGQKVLVFNGVSQQGRCVGNRLPGFVEILGGQTVAAAVFAKGTAEGVRAAEQRFGNKLYATVQVAIPIATPEACSTCRNEPNSKLIPWTDLST